MIIDLVCSLPYSTAYTSSGTSEQNCYQLISSLTSAPAGSPDLFNFECNYNNAAIDDAQVLLLACQQLSQYGCCAATGITMVHQNQVGVLQSVLQNTTNVNFTVFPPCLMRSLHSNCPMVELMKYCPDGSIARTAAMTGSIFLMNITGTAAPFTFPDMYNKESVLKLQGAITYALVNTYGAFAGPPYYMNSDYPFQIQIIDFTYYNGIVTHES